MPAVELRTALLPHVPRLSSNLKTGWEKRSFSLGIEQVSWNSNIPTFSSFPGKGLKLSNPTDTQNGSGGGEQEVERGFLRADINSRRGDTTPRLPFPRVMLWRERREASDSVLKNRLLGVSRENAYRACLQCLRWLRLPRRARQAQDPSILAPCLSSLKMSLSSRGTGTLAFQFRGEGTRGNLFFECLVTSGEGVVGEKQRPAGVT